MRSETVYLAGGCFWCTEAVFKEVSGVLSVTPGYIGGQTTNPTYAQVCSGETGHAEAVRVEYDPSRVSFETLLDIFWRAHDPTQRNRQGADIGTQYRSAIFCTTPEQEAIARHSKEQLIREGTAVVTEISTANTFYPAESYHHNYYQRHPEAPYCRWVIAPKLEKMRSEISRRTTSREPIPRR